MQLITFQDLAPEDLSKDTSDLIHKALKQAGIPHVVYDSIQQADQFAVCVWSEDPSYFSEGVRPVLREFMGKMGNLKLLTTMFGRTYSNGHEADLEFALLKKPPKVVLEPQGEYAIWYPLKRTGSFYLEDPGSQCKMLLEHAAIGRSYGMADLAQDVRLQSFGTDEKDNEFIIGIVGKELHPLSKVIQDMRKTRHTSEFMDSLGPFFVGKRRGRWPEEHLKLSEWIKEVETSKMPAEEAAADGAAEKAAEGGAGAAVPAAAAPAPVAPGSPKKEVSKSGGCPFAAKARAEKEAAAAAQAKTPAAVPAMAAPTKGESKKGSDSSKESASTAESSGNAQSTPEDEGEWHQAGKKGKKKKNKATNESGSVAVSPRSPREPAFSMDSVVSSSAPETEALKPEEVKAEETTESAAPAPKKCPAHAHKQKEAEPMASAPASTVSRCPAHAHAAKSSIQKPASTPAATDPVKVSVPLNPRFCQGIRGMSYRAPVTTKGVYDVAAGAGTNPPAADPTPAAAPAAAPAEAGKRKCPLHR